MILYSLIHDHDQMPYTGPGDCMGHIIMIKYLAWVSQGAGVISAHQLDTLLLATAYKLSHILVQLANYIAGNFSASTFFRLVEIWLEGFVQVHLHRAEKSKNNPLESMAHTFC